MDAELNISPVSALERVRIALPRDRVSIGWLHSALDTEASCLLILVLGLIGALPAASLPAGLAICVLSLRLVWSEHALPLPDLIAMRRLRTPAARYALEKTIALLRFCEVAAPFFTRISLARLRPMAGVVLFFLGASLLIPIPFSNVIPALAASAIALALIEGSPALLLLGVTGGVAGLSLLGFASLAALHAALAI